MYRVGILIGSFNPVHNGHLMMANYVLNEGLVDEVHFIPSPGSFGKPDLEDFYHRVQMLSLAVKDIPKVIVSDIESELSGYTVDTLKYYKERYPNYEICLIIGKDNLEPLRRFKDSDWILSNITLLVLNRKDNDGQNFTMTATYPVISVDFPTVEISSTVIRGYLRGGNSVWAYIPRVVEHYIKTNGLYGTSNSREECKD